MLPATEQLKLSSPPAGASLMKQSADAAVGSSVNFSVGINTLCHGESSNASAGIVVQFEHERSTSVFGHAGRLPSRHLHVTGAGEGRPGA